MPTFDEIRAMFPEEKPSVFNYAKAREMMMQLAAEVAALADKSVPVKPFKESMGDRLCNCCGAMIGWDALNDHIRLAPKYCANCGQPIDWSEEADNV